MKYKITIFILLILILGIMYSGKRNFSLDFPAVWLSENCEKLDFELLENGKRMHYMACIW